MDYETAYAHLFNRITEALEELERSPTVTPELLNGIEILKQAQIKTEEMYMGDGILPEARTPRATLPLRHGRS